MEVNGGSGNATYNIESTSASCAVITVRAGDGDDTFNVSPSAQTLKTIRTPFLLYGGGGSNTLRLIDRQSGPGTYWVYDTHMVRAIDGALPSPSPFDADDFDVARWSDFARLEICVEELSIVFDWSGPSVEVVVICLLLL